MNGTSAISGKRLSGIDHLRQSIRDILTTRIGTRVMRREYGSRLYELIDAPMTRATILDVYAATAEALARWEPRIAVSEIRATDARPGRVVLELTGEYLPTGALIVLDGLEVT